MTTQQIVNEIDYCIAHNKSSNVSYVSGRLKKLRDCLREQMDEETRDEAANEAFNEVAQDAEVNATRFPSFEEGTDV